MFLEIKGKAVNMQYIAKVEPINYSFNNIYLKEDIEHIVTDRYNYKDKRIVVYEHYFLENEYGVFFIDEKICHEINKKYPDIKTYNKSFFCLKFIPNDNESYFEWYENEEARSSDYNKILSL